MDSSDPHSAALGLCKAQFYSHFNTMVAIVSEEVIDAVDARLKLNACRQALENWYLEGVSVLNDGGILHFFDGEGRITKRNIIQEDLQEWKSRWLHTLGCYGVIVGRAIGPIQKVVRGGLRYDENPTGQRSFILKLDDRHVFRHIGKIPAELTRELRDNPGHPAASSFFDERTATSAISKVLCYFEAHINSWRARPYLTKRDATLELPPKNSRFELSRPVGFVLERGFKTPLPTSQLLVVLRRYPEDPHNYWIKTAYPVFLSDHPIRRWRGK